MISRVQEVTCQLSSANRKNQNQTFSFGRSQNLFWTPLKIDEKGQDYEKQVAAERQVLLYRAYLSAVIDIQYCN